MVTPCPIQEFGLSFVYLSHCDRQHRVSNVPHDPALVHNEWTRWIAIHIARAVPDLLAIVDINRSSLFVLLGILATL